MKLFGSRILMIIAVMGFSLTACKDKDAERKIAALEDRLAQLETTGGTSVTTTPATPVVSTPATKPEGPLPTLDWGDTEWDFGTINEGDVVEHSYTFVNTGQAPLIIESAKPSCGCTVPSWTKEPIPVGGTGEILVKFDSKGKPNIQTKTVTVTSNTWPKVTTLRFKTFVTPKAK